jgi:hypothetical protein
MPLTVKTKVPVPWSWPSAPTRLKAKFDSSVTGKPAVGLMSCWVVPPTLVSRYVEPEFVVKLVFA